jgi:hypothetical protein
MVGGTGYHAATSSDRYYYAVHAGARVTFPKFIFLRRVSHNLPKHQKTDHGSVWTGTLKHYCSFYFQVYILIKKSTIPLVVVGWNMKACKK